MHLELRDEGTLARPRAGDPVFYQALPTAAIALWFICARCRAPISESGQASARVRVRGTFSLVSFWDGCYSATMPDGQSRVNISGGETTDDRELLRAVAGRDREAFQQLYARHSAMLFGLALKILSDRAEAEDVLQDAFIQVWKTAGSFDEGRGKPLGWFIMLIRSRAIDRLRSRKTRTRLNESVAKDGAPGAAAATPVDEAVASEAQRAVRNALNALPADQRLPIEMAYFGGLTQFEIAQQLSQPLGTVKTRIRTGMIHLREQLGGGAGGSRERTL